AAMQWQQRRDLRSRRGSVRVPTSTGARFDPAAGPGPHCPPRAPQPREHASVTWTGTDLVVWGGASGITALGSGARWNAASDTWSPMPTAGAPAPRSHHSAAWTGSELIVWGGTASNSDLANGARWSQACSAVAHSS